MPVVKVTDPVLREYCIAALNYYHPHGGRTTGYGSKFHSLYIWMEEPNIVASILLLTTNLKTVFNKARKSYPELAGLKYRETLFIKRILNIPPHNKLLELLLGVEPLLREQGVKALFSYVYPGLPGKIYQLAKYKFGWTRGGYQFVYKRIEG